MKAYDYWWGYTKAQIELMVADQPIISYDDDEGKPPSRSEADALADAWAEKRKSRKLQFKKGEKISLSEYLNE